MITHCPKCGRLILDPNGTTRSHKTFADCLRALMVELVLIDKKITEIMQEEIEKREELEAEFAKLAERFKRDELYDQ